MGGDFPHLCAVQMGALDDIKKFAFYALGVNDDNDQPLMNTILMQCHVFTKVRFYFALHMQN